MSHRPARAAAGARVRRRAALLACLAMLVCASITQATPADEAGGDPIDLFLRLIACRLVAGGPFGVMLAPHCGG